MFHLIGAASGGLYRCYCFNALELSPLLYIKKNKNKTCVCGSDLQPLTLFRFIGEASGGLFVVVCLSNYPEAVSLAVKERKKKRHVSAR